ncbi:MAG: cytochrome c4 [Alteromonadaceae bacterium]|nr:cytochrome c4 [Alteromonadaceae bacterium]
MNKILLSLLLTLSALNVAIAAQGNVETGKAKSAMCAACHGGDGNSLIPMYPKLAGQSANYIAKQLADFKKGATSAGKEGRADPIMAGMVMALSEQDMADLGAYYATQTRSAGASKGDASGHALYVGGDVERKIPACAGCHGTSGKGMAAAGFPSLAAQQTVYLKNQLVKFRSGSRANDKNAIMRNIATELSDSEIDALAQQISSLK